MNKSYILQRWDLVDEGYGRFGDRFINNEMKHRYPVQSVGLTVYQKTHMIRPLHN